MSGVTPDTYKYAVSDIRLDDNTVLSTYEGQSFSMSCVDSKGFVIEADTANNIWNYHSSDGENSFFSLPDVVDVTLGVDGDMLIRCLDLSSDNIISYYKYSPPPVSVHPFHTTWRLETQAKCPTAHPTLRQPIPRPTVLPTRYICLMQTV
ncbi:MAG: hypothetical protein ACLRI8_04450 [Agathobacter rectalis]